MHTVQYCHNGTAWELKLATPNTDSSVAIHTCRALKIEGKVFFKQITSDNSEMYEVLKNCQLLAAHVATELGTQNN